MKKPTDHLFQLIQSLTHGEKKVFKLLAKRYVRGAKNNYIILYEAIEKQRKYDETALRIKLKKQINVSNLPYEKNNLYNLVCNSLVIYHSDKSNDAKLFDQIRLTKIFYDKGLDVQGERKLNQAIAFAKKYEKFLILQELYVLERRFLARDSDAQLTERKMDSIHAERLAARMQEDITNYNELYLKIHERVVRSGNDRTVKYKKQLENLLGHPLLQDESRASSENSKYLFYYCYYTYYFLINEPQKKYNYAEKLVKLEESSSILIEDNPRRYLMTLFAMLQAEGDQYQIKSMQITFSKMKKIAEDPKYFFYDTTRAYFTIWGYVVFTNTYLAKGDFKNLLDMMGEIQNTINHLKNAIPEIASFALYYNIAYAYFANREFKLVLLWISNILNKPNLKLGFHIHAATRILNLAVHFELKNYELLEYEIRSSVRFLEKKQRLLKIEMETIEFFRSYLKSSGDSKLTQQLMTRAHEKIRILKKNTQEIPSLSLFDIESWLESKINGTQYSDVVKGNRSHLTTK